MTSAERKRVDSFGHPEDGLYESTPWYLWGQYRSERAWRRCARTTAPPGRRGITSRTTMPVPARTAGVRTAWPLCW